MQLLTLMEFKCTNPWQGNFYPVNAAMYLQDALASMAMVVNRSQGGALLHDGQMTPYPPYGNDTRVDGSVIARGVHRLLVGKGAVGASLARSVMDAAFAEPLVLVGTAPAVVAADDDE